MQTVKRNRQSIGKQWAVFAGRAWCSVFCFESRFVKGTGLNLVGSSHMLAVFQSEAYACVYQSTNPTTKRITTITLITLHVRSVFITGAVWWCLWWRQYGSLIHMYNCSVCALYRIRHTNKECTEAIHIWECILCGGGEQIGLKRHLKITLVSWVSVCVVALVDTSLEMIIRLRCRIEVWAKQIYFHWRVYSRKKFA